MIRLALATILGNVFIATALAHTGGATHFATVTVSGQTVRYSLGIARQSIPQELADRMRLAQVGAEPDFEALLAAVTTRIKIIADGIVCDPLPGVVTPAPARDAVIQISLDYKCANAPHQLAIRDDLFDFLGTDHHTLALIVWPGGSQQFMFQPDLRETRIRLTSATSASGTQSFLLLGIEHILIGWDHLLFLMCLLLLGGRFWSLIKIVTAFTVAHSITLAAAALDLVSLPSRLVESAIALSIAYVAAENVFLRDRAASKRWLVAFVFGLVHGFGFSSVLRELGLPREGLIWSLLGFNLGVEAGQATVIAIAMPMLLQLRKVPWEPRAVATVSAVVLAVGLGLFVERAFF